MFSNGSTTSSNIFSQGVDVWTSIDKQLCELVARLARRGYRRSLEVEFQFPGGEKDLRECDLTKFLLEFKDKVKGVVNITCIPQIPKKSARISCKYYKPRLAPPQ